jgi:hypothetical protein
LIADLQAKRWARGGCPRCAAMLPLRTIIAGLGKKFPCNGCDGALFIPKVSFGVLAMGFLPLSLAFKFLDLPMVVVMLLFAAFMVAEWAFRKVYLIEE